MVNDPMIRDQVIVNRHRLGHRPILFENRVYIFLENIFYTDEWGFNVWFPF